MSGSRPPERGPSREAGAPLPIADAAVGEAPGDAIDRYTLVERIGEGGMGTVWRAEQAEPVRRSVALKVIKLGMDTREVVARFEAERQALAMMDHPSIAKVHDAGVTETGRPYFVMELVRGAPITDFCDAERLTTAQRLALFRQVCLAVQHAHQKGVLHRDLKPSNVLVAMVDGVPQPKVIDFGIAKATEKPLTDSSLATAAFQIVGTPQYMPPEQAAGQDVDTRADVYSLGVVLYELLTGVPPFGDGTTSLDSLGELLRQIHEVTPPKPSTRASELGVALDEVARTRRQPTGTFPRSLRGDLDWIVMKALEKDRERRYATALDLAEDVERHLANEPVVASPPSTTYRLRKFVRRNRLAVASAGVVVATLVVSTIGLALLYSRAVASEARATRQAETSRRALGFLTEMFQVSDPSEARGETVTAREILDRGAERIDRELADQPEIRSTLSATMGEVYTGLGLYARAEELMHTAATIRSELSGAEHPEALRLTAGVADLLGRQSRHDEAEDLLRETIARQERVLGPDHRDVIDSRLVLSRLLELRSQLDDAEALAREALAAARRTLGEDHELVLLALNRLAVVLESAGRYEEAEEAFREALAVSRRTLGDDHPTTLSTTAGLAELCTTMGRFEEAEALLREAEATARRVFGDEHPLFTSYRSKLGLLYFEQQRWSEAEAISRELVEIQGRVLGADHLDTLLSRLTLGATLSNQGRFDEAEQVYLEALDGLVREMGEQSEHTQNVVANLAILYLQTDRLEEAEEWATRAYEGTRALLGEDHPETILRLENLGNVRYTRGDGAGTAELLDEVLASRRRALGDEHPAVTRTLVNIAVVRNSIGDDERATAAREELLERTRAGLGFDYASVADEIEQLAHVRFRAGDFEGAADCVREVLRIRRAALGPEHEITLATMRDCMKGTIQVERWDEFGALAAEAFEAHVRVLGPDHADTAECLEVIVGGCEARGDEAQAAAWRAKLADAGEGR